MWRIADLPLRDFTLSRSNDGCCPGVPTHFDAGAAFPARPAACLTAAWEGNTHEAPNHTTAGVACWRPIHYLLHQRVSQTKRCLSVVLVIAAAGPAWADGGQMLVPRYAHTATLLDGGRVLIFGGLTQGDAFIRSAELFDPVTGRSSPAPAPHKSRAFHTATTLPDGTVLIAGGFVRPYSTSRTAELFNGQAFIFLESRMSAPRELHAATLLDDGRVLIAGGFVGGVTSLAQCDLFSPVTRRFVPTGKMRCSRFGHAATRLSDGRVLITGGAQYPGEKTLDDAEIYDPRTGEFLPAGEMLAQRSRHTATLLPDGSVLITGGYSAKAGRQLAATELFDPSSVTFAPGPEMAVPRMDHTATLLRDGRVLIAGGLNGIGGPHTVASCEIFDPQHDAFSPASSLPSAVHEHKATLLPDGTVLICGGLAIRAPARRTVADVVSISP